MSFDEPDDDIDAFISQAPRVLEHGVGLADARRGAEKDLQPARGLPAERRQKRVRIRASGVGSVDLGHLSSWVLTTLLTHPALNSAAKRYLSARRSTLKPDRRLRLRPTPAPCLRASPAPSPPGRLGPGRFLARRQDRAATPTS